MIKSLPTIADLTQYDTQVENNNSHLTGVLDTLFPNLTIPHENVYKILQYLDQTSVNPEILPRVIRSVQNIILGTGQGEVLIHVRKEAMTVEARERDVQISTKQLDTKL
jgi:hypothetical protein